MLRELVDVVGYLHRHNVVHCDIKPDNIMITANSRNLVLIDFDKCYTDSLSDTSGHPSKYGLTADEPGRVAIDFRGIGMVVEKLKANVPGFKFSNYEPFVTACYAADVDSEDLAAILNQTPSAVDDEQRKAHLKVICERLYKAFRRKQEPKTMYKCVPRYISIGTLQAMKNMTQNDIEEAVKYGNCFRLRNLANAESRGKHSVDQLAVEMFPHNTIYGCCIDRKSDITIVCPTALSEAGIGNFSYYLALTGGFNYISKEVEEDVDDPASFYIISDQQRNGSLAQYLADVKRLSSGKGRWTIFVISSETAKDADIHFLTNANAHTGRETTIVDQIGFDRLYSMATTDLEEELGIKSDLNQLRAAGPKNVSVIAGGGMDTNTFTIRIFSELIVWDTRYMAVAKTLATAMSLTLGESYGETMTDPVILKESGFGYQL